MKRFARTDANQREIVKALRAAGYQVLSLATIGKGVPDLLVTTGEETFLAEVKDGTGKKLTPDQEKFHSEWRGRLEIFTSVEQALEIMSSKQGKLL